ncbi:MAG: prepilin-type N-terminal cleavage/methylation domain-containing protein [Endomicrobia bacterium]|nr:prepilin-type N-terminal cleavage/methylation domain-containing protein [Endomicrobiia bacterium]
MKKNLGFTLAEVIIVIVIVGILSIIAVPIYRDHVKKSVSVEGQALLSEIMAAQEIYFNRYASWWEENVIDTVQQSTRIGVDARRNRYFNSFSWTGRSDVARSTDTADQMTESFRIVTNGATNTRAQGISLTLIYKKGTTYQIVQN